MSVSSMSTFPKVELHRHLEGALRSATVRELTAQFGMDSQPFQVLSPMQDLKEVLNVFWAVQRLFKHVDVVERVAYEVVEDAFHDGIRLLELRYSPGFMTSGHSLSFSDVHEAIVKGVSRARAKYDIQVPLIGIISRSLEEGAWETVDFILSHRDTFVALDLADVEDRTPIEELAPLTAKVRKAGLGVTVHSGEDTDAQHVMDTIEHLKPHRIGHGIRIDGHPEAMALARKMGIVFEMCPTSNVLTRCVESAEAHPLARVRKNGIKATINSDDPGIFGISLSHEYQLCQDVLRMTKDDLMAATLEALEASFADTDVKTWVRKRLLP